MTLDEAIAIAKENGMLEEFYWSLDSGCTPEEALYEWDLI